MDVGNPRAEPVAGSERAPSLETAARRLAPWGFLADPDLPDRPGPASLIVALRERPTLRHYDPEVVEFWSAQGGRGTHQTITLDSRTPFSTGVSWGEIRILDRLGESNGYLGFGGRCDADRLDGTVIVAFTSSAPILRRGGHSQGWDEGADAVGAFFGRLLVTVDYVPGFEQRLAQASPLARYAAFIQDADGRNRSTPLAARDLRPFARTVRSEAARLGSDHPAAWRDGVALLADVGRTLQMDPTTLPDRP
ncbi:MAG TPA: hypothetical protein VHK05_00750 [Candidatus Limnocylindrales bacterium]|jgi:hypothetical protein|nr:hypothetical protein [Candidatus Limnocylindrales bacterium]